jgi:hypothetical protein
MLFIARTIRNTQILCLQSYFNVAAGIELCYKGVQVKLPLCLDTTL